MPILPCLRFVGLRINRIDGQSYRLFFFTLHCCTAHSEMRTS